MKTIHRIRFLAPCCALLALCAFGCSRSNGDGAGVTAETAAKRYPLKGVVVDFVPASAALMVKHEDIPGLMAGMTMMFKADPATLKAVKKGQAIEATLVVKDDGYWLEEVKPRPQSQGTADLVHGRAVFERVCAVCHQANGAGVPGVFPPLAGSEILTQENAGWPVRIALFGLQGPVEVGGRTYNSAMPPQGPVLKDDEIAEALSYARSAWGNQAPPVSAETVRTVRASVKRETMWTWGELKRETGDR